MKKVQVNIFCCLLASSCWGNTVLYYAVVAALVCILFFETNKISIRTVLAAFVVSAFFDSSIAVCSSLICVLLMICGYRKEAASYIATQLPLLLSPFIETPIYLLHPITTIVTYGMFLGCFYGTDKYKFNLKNIPVIIYACLLAVVSCISWELDSASEPSAPAGYRIGDAISKLTSKESSPTGQIIYDNSHYTEVRPSGTLYLDHDAQTQWNEGNFRQNRPWGHNLPIGSELIKKAMLRDGAWICNIGTSLNCSNSCFIGGFFQDGKITSIIIAHENNLIFGDSDFAVDCLAPYQKNLIGYLVGSDVYSRLFHFICAICLIVACFWNPHALIVLLCFANVILLWIPCQGDVRYVGKAHRWAHTDLGEGIVRALQQHGENVIFGNRNTKILVIGEGYSASLAGEKIVILEPNAEVEIRDVCYQADIVPLGQLNGITDAREIIVNGKRANSNVLHIGGVTIIATGTPTALSKDLIWKF